MLTAGFKYFCRIQYYMWICSFCWSCLLFKTTYMYSAYVNVILINIHDTVNVVLPVHFCSSIFIHEILLMMLQA